MSTDRELLELAAKAAGYEIEESEVGGKIKLYRIGELLQWNPLTDDGDALRLAVRLRLNVYHESNLADVHGTVNGRDVYATEAYLDDPYAASRRAIVCAAAEIGKAMA
jgi:hypothetical protein